MVICSGLVVNFVADVCCLSTTVAWEDWLRITFNYQLLCFKFMTLDCGCVFHCVHYNIYNFKDSGVFRFALMYSVHQFKMCKGILLVLNF